MRSGRPGSPLDGGVHTLKAVVVIAVVVILGVFLLYKVKTPAKTTAAVSSGVATTTHVPHSAGPTTSLPRSTTTTSLVPVSSVKLQVLNGVLTGSLAGQWSTKLKANPGYNTLAPDNATAKVASSVIYVITPGYGPEANALAAVVGLTPSAVQTTLPSSAPIPAADKTNANLVLIIGPDLEATA
jgi:hypothetical protein